MPGAWSGDDRSVAEEVGDLQRVDRKILRRAQQERLRQIDLVLEP